MIPYRDNIPPARVPYVNHAILAVYVLVWLWQLSAPHHGAYDLGMVPARVLGDDSITITVEQPLMNELLGLGSEAEVPIGPAAVPEWLTPLTGTFLHASWFSLLSTLLLLWIFGDNVEDRLGHFRYAAFYVLSGAAMSLLLLAIEADSEFAIVGAGFGIPAVIGAYCFLYPDARVHVLLWFYPVVRVLEAPAAWLFGACLAVQLVFGMLAWGFGDHFYLPAWLTIAGFAAGLGVAYELERRQRLGPAVKTRRRPPGRGRDQLRRFDPLGKPR